MRTVRDLVAIIGTQEQIADDLGVHQTSVSNWIRRDYLPEWTWDRLMALARAQGAEIDANAIHAVNVPPRPALAGREFDRPPKTAAPDAPSSPGDG